METVQAIDFLDFEKINICIGTVTNAEKVPETDKLLKLSIDFGKEERTIVTGMAEFFEPSHFVGKQIPVLVNLVPRKIKGIESQGMILAAEADGRPVLLHPENEIAPGSVVR